MNRLGGLSGEKLPAFLTDLYADLRDRRLLPLVALLIVGIVAAPILLKDKEATSPPPVPPVAGSSAADTSFAVVPAKQELQSGKRLAGRTAKNPFSPRVVEGGEAEAGGEPSGGSSGATVASSESTSTTVTEETTKDKVTPAPVRYVPAPVSFGIDALIGMLGHSHEVRAIRSQTKLPSPKNPVVIYMGPSKDRRHALFLPSSQVLSYTGPVHCAAEKADCQLLEVGLGAPVDFVYGSREQHFDLTVERFVPIEQLPHGKERVIRGK